MKNYVYIIAYCKEIYIDPDFGIFATTDKEEAKGHLEFIKQRVKKNRLDYRVRNFRIMTLLEVKCKEG